MNKCNISSEERGETYRIGSALRQSEVKTILSHVMVSCQSSHSMTSFPQQIAVPFAVCIFGGFGEMPWQPSPPKIQGCRIDQQIQRWLKDQLQDSIANKGMAWPSHHATTIRHNIEIFQVILSNLMFR